MGLCNRYLRTGYNSANPIVSDNLKKKEKKKNHLSSNEIDRETFKRANIFVRKSGIKTGFGESRFVRSVKRESPAGEAFKIRFQIQFAPVIRRNLDENLTGRELNRS